MARNYSSPRVSYVHHRHMKKENTMEPGKQGTNDNPQKGPKSDQRQPHPRGLANQNVTRPAPVDQPENRQSEPAQRDTDEQK
jgi:hypothetical protein